MFHPSAKSVAEVTISIKNQGEEAYKPKEYGKSIVITRRFTKEGSSSWKIKSKDGRVISTKKDELSAICDHMNIQVDNPMNVLTQGMPFTPEISLNINAHPLADAARWVSKAKCLCGSDSRGRQFLSASRPADKYKVPAFAWQYTLQFLCVSPRA
jgi:hypothetical protein